MNNYHYPRLTKVNKYLLIFSAGLFLLSSILKAIGAISLPGILGLSGAGLMSGMIWQLVTFPFMEGQLFGLLFNALLIWFIGSELEELWGGKVYLRFLTLVTVASGLFYALLMIIFFNGTSIFFKPLYGLTGINFSLLIAYAYLYPDRPLSMMMIFPMRAKTFCWILVGIEAYMAIFSSASNSWAHLMAMGIGYFVIKFQNQFLISKFLHFEFTGSKKRKNHLYVVPDKKDESNQPKYWQ